MRRFGVWSRLEGEGRCTLRKEDDREADGPPPALGEHGHGECQPWADKVGEDETQDYEEHERSFLRCEVEKGSEN